MKKHLRAIIGTVALVTVFSTGAFAANPEIFNVTVSIAAVADITVVQGGPIAFGVMSVGSESVSTSAIAIKNSGSGSAQTYSLSLTNPAGWTAVTTAPGTDTYRLSAAFDADGVAITWDPLVHALTTTPTPSTVTKFASDQTGTGVTYDAQRNLYLKIETPTLTTSPSEKTIAVTITAAVD